MEQELFDLKNGSTEQIIRYYADMVYRLAFARTGSKYDADDIFQEVFLRYVRSHPSFTSEEHRKAWLLRVTVNCSHQFFYAFRRTKEQELTEAPPATPFSEEDTSMYEQLLKLPPKYREVIHLFYYEDLSAEEISRMLNRKYSTVRTQLTRARALLRDFLEEEKHAQRMESQRESQRG